MILCSVLVKCFADNMPAFYQHTAYRWIRAGASNPHPCQGECTKHKALIGTMDQTSILRFHILAKIIGLESGLSVSFPGRESVRRMPDGTPVILSFNPGLPPQGSSDQWPRPEREFSPKQPFLQAIHFPRVDLVIVPKQVENTVQKQFPKLDVRRQTPAFGIPTGNFRAYHNISQQGRPVICLAAVHKAQDVRSGSRGRDTRRSSLSWHGCSQTPR